MPARSSAVARVSGYDPQRLGMQDEMAVRVPGRGLRVIDDIVAVAVDGADGHRRQRLRHLEGLGRERRLVAVLAAASPRPMSNIFSNARRSRISLGTRGAEIVRSSTWTVCDSAWAVRAV